VSVDDRRDAVDERRWTERSVSMEVLAGGEYDGEATESSEVLSFDLAGILFV